MPYLPCLTMAVTRSPQHLLSGCSRGVGGKEVQQAEQPSHGAAMVWSLLSKPLGVGMWLVMCSLLLRACCVGAAQARGR